MFILQIQIIRLIYKSRLDLLYLKGLGGLFLARAQMIFSNRAEPIRRDEHKTYIHNTSSAPKIKGTHKGAFYFWLSGLGIEGERYYNKNIIYPHSPKK